MNWFGNRRYDARVVIYTRQGCHLCDDAQELVGRYVSDITLVDIDEDPTLVEKFTTCVPVVEINGKIRFRGRVDERLLKRTLSAEAGRSQ